MTMRKEGENDIAGRRLLLSGVVIVFLIWVAIAHTWWLIGGLALIVAGLLTRWALFPTRDMPRRRVLHMRLRMMLRLRPGHGHAALHELHWRWGRLASYRESKRTRPSLTRWQRLRDARSHSVYLGRAHFGHAVRVSVQEHGAVIGPPRHYKSALLAHVILDAPGAVVSTSSKPDMHALTAAHRARGGPVYTFNPQSVGGIPSNVFWSPLDGCIDATTAIRRADAFANAASTAGAEDAAFWAGKASDGMRGLFAAAAVSGHHMRRVGRWVTTSSATPEAAAILLSNGYEDWAGTVSELNGDAHKTAETIRMVMSRALGFLADPSLARAVSPGPGEQFDIDHFLLSGGTLYMIARGSDKDSTLAPLYAALASEIQHRAVQLGAVMPRGRLDPPMAMVLDEVTQICPVPLPAWLADSGGQGVTIWTGFHGTAQLRSRWGVDGAQTVMDTSNVKIFTAGISDIATLSMASTLSGQVGFYEEGHGGAMSRHDVMTSDMIRQMLKGWALVIRDGAAPVVVRLARGWRHRGARKLARRAAPAPMPVAQPAPEPAPLEPVIIPSAVTAASAQLVPWTPEYTAPEPAQAASGNGNGHGNGVHPWSAK